MNEMMPDGWNEKDIPMYMREDEGRANFDDSVEEEKEKQETTKIDEPGREATINRSQKIDIEKGVKTTTTTESTEAVLTPGEASKFIYEQKENLSTALKSGEIDSSEKMLKFISDIKEKFTGDGELSEMEKRSWERNFKSLKRSLDFPTFEGKLDLIMSAYISSLEKK